MPFIRGRYYANSIVGNAIEAAREAEDRAIASPGEQEGHSRLAGEAQDAKPVSKIEIEIAALVPAHTGHAEQGYVARLHYPDTEGADGSARPTDKHVFSDPEQLVSFLRNELAKNGAVR